MAIADVDVTECRYVLVVGSFYFLAFKQNNRCKFELAFSS